MPVQRHLGLRLHLLGNEVPQLVGGLLTGLQAFLVHPVAQLVHQFDGHFAAHVGQDELFFQAVVEVIVDLAAGQCIEDVAPEARAGLLQAIFHFIFFFFAKSKESHGRPPLSYAFCAFFRLILRTTSQSSFARQPLPFRHFRATSPGRGSLS